MATQDTEQVQVTLTRQQAVAAHACLQAQADRLQAAAERGEGRASERVMTILHAEQLADAAGQLRLAMRLAPQAPPAQPVVEGPTGHWYAMHAGELVGLPRTPGDHRPAHPCTLNRQQLASSGWYAVEDLPSRTRAQVLRQLQNAREVGSHAGVEQ